MKLLSQELVSSEYRQRIRRDLERAKVCRFLMGYVSEDGLKSIGWDLLVRALQDSRSFGASSLTCACGYKPLLRLQDELGDSIRLKYFMDPLVDGSDEPSNISLFHSKLVYLFLEREQKSVVYIGSHNWSQRALGHGGPRNAEASLRFESEFAPEHLEGEGESFSADVNRHLLEAYDFKACYPATRANETTFKQWFQKGCGRAPQALTQEVTVLLAVRKGDGTSFDPEKCQNLVDCGIYLQVLEEDEGQMMWQSSNPIVLLVWDSVVDLRAGGQPILFCCRETTRNAGPDSQLQGTNQSVSPIAGFEAVLFDENQLAALRRSSHVSRKSASIWSGRNVEIYDFEFPTEWSDSSQVDAGVAPRYQFHLEVECVAFPADGHQPDAPKMLWTRESFAVARLKRSAKYWRLPGYHVSAELEREIRGCLSEVLNVDLQRAKVLPVSDFDAAKVGKRLSRHGLHETYIGKDLARKPEELYAKVELNTLVADLDEFKNAPEEKLVSETPPPQVEPVGRVQRVYTTKLDQLKDAWKTNASHLRNQRRDTDGD